jgi:hypothetical protein
MLFDEDHSSGLFEYIYNIWLFQRKPIIDINLIGLPDDENLCKSLIYGIMIYNKIYKQIYFDNSKINFNYYIYNSLEQDYHTEILPNIKNLLLYLVNLPEMPHNFITGAVNIYYDDYIDTFIFDEGKLKN